MKSLVILPFAFAFYLLLSGGLGAEQLISAAVMSVIALAWSTLLRVGGGPRRFAFTAAHAAPWLRAIARLPVDTLRIGMTLARAATMGGSPGHAPTVSFRFGAVDDPVEAARRATAVAAGSLTPDAFIVDIEPGRATALCHKLARTPAPANGEWLA